MKNLRIVMIAACPFPANHGTPGAIRELAMYLVRQGHEVHVVTYPDYEEGIPIDGLIIHRVLPAKKSQKIVIGPSLGRLVNDFFLIPKLLQVIWKYNINIIHAHNYEATIAGAIAKLFTRRRLVYNGVNSMFDELPTYEFFKSKATARRLGKFLDKVVPNLADMLMLLSDELKAYLIDEIGINPEKIIVIPPGVEPEMFANGDGDAVRQRHHLQGKPIVMYTGALEAFQKVDYLFDAMVEVVVRIPDVKLLMVTNVNNDKAKAKYEQMAIDLGFYENLVFADRVSLKELPDYLAAADVAVLPRTACPGYPIKLLNYMAAAKAIVAFKGSAKALCHRYNGYVAEDDDIQSFANGIVLLLADPEIRHTLGERAKTSIPGVFDWDTLARGTALVYEKLLIEKQPFIDKRSLNGYLKKSYIPQFKSGLANTVDSQLFLRNDPIEFPEF
ncbi:glycosyltransferase family 4 protein [Methylosoma difficile]